MDEPSVPFRSPFTPYPGGATAPPDEPPEVSRRELWTFFWFSILSSAIIGGAGVVAFFLATR